MRKVPFLLPLVALPLLTACGTTQSTPPASLGRDPFPKYALNLANNPVLETGGNRGFTAQWAIREPEPLLNDSLVHGVLYVGGLGPLNQVYAIHAGTGRTIWATPLDNQVMTTPVYARGLLFVGTGNRHWVNKKITYDPKATHLVRGTGPSSVVALSARSGQVVWSRTTRGEDMPSFVIHHGIVYLANGGDHVYALAAQTGRVLWKTAIPSYVSMSSLAYDKGLLFFGGAHPYAVYAISATTGQPAWIRPIPASIGGLDDCSPAISRGILVTEASLAPFSHPQPALIALSEQTGAVLWTKTLRSGPMIAKMETAAPVIAGGRVYAANPIAKRLAAFSLQSGRVLWSIPTPFPIKSSPVVYRGRLYIADAKGNLYKIDARTGRILATRHLGGVMAADYPILAGNTLFLTSRQGQAWAIPLSRI